MSTNRRIRGAAMINHRTKPEGLMVIVGWDYAAFPDVDDRKVIRDRTSVHMSDETLDPPLTQAEIQSIAYAAKMACARVLRARSRARRGGR